MTASLSELFKRITLGIYVVGVTDGTRQSAFTAAWVTQVSFDPLMLAVSINTHGSSFPLVERGKVFSVNVLATGQTELARHFGTSGLSDKLAGHAWRAGKTGSPLLEEALAWFDCEWVASYPAGDHALVLGRVVDGRLLAPEQEPLTYRGTGNLDGADSLYPSAFPE